MALALLLLKLNGQIDRNGLVERIQRLALASFALFLNGAALCFHARPTW
jgi:hypothetical protein